MIKDFLKNIITDVRIDLTEEFDRNFERKAFFDKKWTTNKVANQRGSLLMRTGKLRRSIRGKESVGQVSWTSSLPYASIHNEGGEIEVTAKMKRFFWAMYIKAEGGTTFKRDKDQNVVLRNTARNRRLTEEAKMWKALALQKLGAKMKVDQRQFIGDHPVVRQRIESIISDNFKELEKEFLNKLKQ